MPVSSHVRLAQQQRSAAIGQRVSRELLAMMMASLVATMAGQETLVERTVAIVGGTVITLSDVRTALALHLVETTTADAEHEAAARLIDRWLVLHEVSRFAPPEPAPASIDDRVAAIEARAGSAAALDATLARGGFSRGRLAAWVRDDLRIAAYLDQRFATTGVPGQDDVAAYVETHAAELERAAATAEERVRLARAGLEADRRRDLIADWLAELRRRIPVVEFKD